MSSPSRFTAGVACKILAIFALVAVLFVAGCTTSNTVANTAPGFSSATSTAFTIGVAGSFTVTATGSPAPTLAESGALPNGVTFSAASGVLAGTPATGTAGSYPVTFTATNGVGTGATQSFTLTVVAPPVITSFTAAKTTITAGTSTSLTAVFSGGTGSINNGVGTVSSNTAVTITPAATTTYTLTVTNTAGAAVTSTATVTVVPAPSITSFLAAKTTITLGTSTTLTAVFVGTGSIDNGVGAVTSGAPVTITPAATTTYTLTVTNAAGATAAPATATVTVVPAPAITSFIAAAASITAGTPTTLTAAFVNGTGSVNNGVGAVNSGIAANITPAATTTYTLTVTNAAGTAVTATATVTVVPAPIITSFTAAQTTITAGNPTSLTAVFSGGTGSVDSGVGGVNSNVAANITPVATTTYTLTVTNTLGASVTATATVTVVPAPQITSFIATPSTIVLGNPATLTAAFTNGNGTVNNGVGAVSSGTGVNVSPAVTTIYTLTVTNAAGTSVTAQATVTVNTPATITSANSATFTVGSNGSFTVTTTGNPTPTTVTKTSGALPNNVTFTDNGNGTATISGIPQTGTVGNYPITITAHNGIGVDATQVFTLAVVLTLPPTITSANSAAFTVSAAGTFTVTTTGSPVSTITKVGNLPSGVNFTDNGNGTATIAGTPAAGTIASYAITITANNGIGTAAQQSFTLNVVAAPTITSFAAAAGTITAGNSTNLTAVFAGGTGTVNNGVGTVSSNAAASVSPSVTTTYTLTVTNAAGTSVTAQALVTVVATPVITSFTPGAATITAGTTTTLTAVFTNGAGSVDNSIGNVTSGASVNVTPAVTTTYTLTVTNAAGTFVTAQATITVNSAPQITSANSASFALNSFGTFTVTTTGSPTPSLTNAGGTGLPGTITFVDNHNGTATISGTPTAGGAFTTTITASNGIGTNATQNFTLTVTSGPPSVGITVPGPIFANGNAENISIIVANDAAGDALSVTSFTVGGVACTTATCGTLGGSISGTSGGGNYALSYTPPATLAAVASPTLVVSSSLANSFAATVTFNVNPAGAIVVNTGGPGVRVVPNGPSSVSQTVTVYNDVASAGATISLQASGYACPSTGSGGTVCGTLVVGSATTGTTATATTGIPFTRYAITYTPPSSIPNSPYDRPMILAVSNADRSKIGINSFLISSNPQGSLVIPLNSELDSALTTTPVTLTASLNGDTGNSKTMNWTLTANGTTCAPPTCGTLGTPTYTRNQTVTNGTSVTATITYTPPTTVPSGSGQNFPTITATSVDNLSANDSFTFRIVDGTCGTGNEAVLNGQYAFLLKGGSAGNGYNAFIGSFTANAAGVITSGFEDLNRTAGGATGLTLTGTYSVGSDNRGCLTLVNSAGGTMTYRIALGTVSGGSATQGTITFFGDNTGQGMRLSGVLEQQNLAGLTSSTFSGTYVLGEDGVDGSGGRIAAAGLLTSNGAGTTSNIGLDTDDNGFVQTLSGGSGSYSLATNAAGGRATFSTSFTTGGGTSTTNGVVYIVSSSDALFMSTDPLGSSNVIVSGELKKQQAAAFTTTALDNKNYVFYVSGIESSSGGNDITIGQSTNTTNGAATVTLDENDNGIEQTEQIQPTTFVIAPNGRMTISGGGNHSPVFYLIDSIQGFIVGTDSTNLLGYLQQQTGGPFSTATISGQFFFGGGAANTGTSYESGTATFVPGIPSGTITGFDDQSSPNNTGCSQNCNGNGLRANSPLSGDSGTAATYCFSTSPCSPTPTAPGQGNLGSNSLGYIVSPTKVIFLNTGGTTQQNSSAAEIYIIQK